MVDGKLLTAKQILEADDIKTERLAVPEWGGDVLVKALTGAERDAFEEEIIQIKGKKTTMNRQNFRARFVAASLVDEDGKKLFTPDQIKALGQKSAAALQRVFDLAADLSGLSDEDEDELIKNSEGVRSEDSTLN